MNRAELTVLLLLGGGIICITLSVYEYLGGSQEPHSGAVFAIAGGGLTLLGMIGVVYLDRRKRREARRAGRL